MVLPVLLFYTWLFGRELSRSMFRVSDLPVYAEGLSSRVSVLPVYVDIYLSDASGVKIHVYCRQSEFHYSREEW